ncbi:MAG: NAD(P)/FAD-dependent oxidoreductase [Candidatus Eisenbacteria bacterium]|uniref:Pyridine nucleotide-disulfide oxidoreductase domain-containing protein 2 n=1 Tax=Eiseniibacteriota bacterium TaxID=2212470 RepID=A0A849SAI5_UNCEI|nr:NAD(P)/FAD-dependent oxidoreductase [Candidatus Eisenbacteria bacterium]
MSQPGYDAIVIGAGANGLVAAARLGLAGRRVLLLERTDSAGGQGAVTEFAPGFHAAPLGLDAGWLPPSIALSLNLDGLEPATGDAPLSVAIAPGAFLTLASDVRTAADAIRVHSIADAAKWPAFAARLRSLTEFLEALYVMDAPDVDARSLGELLPLLGLGQKFRALGKTDMIELLRTLPMSVWELLDDWFETTALKAAVATGGIQDYQQGPRSGGTGFVLLHHLVGASAGTMRGRPAWRGGPGAFTDAAERAARRAGVTIRTAAEVARIQVRDDAVVGVVLASGEEIAARAVLSTAEARRTMLDWVDPVWLDPEFMRDVQNIRFRGCTAIVLYALDALPAFKGLGAEASLGGMVSLTTSLVALEKAADAAKYGEVSERPHVEFSVPSVRWPNLAPGGKHVLVARVQYAPYRLKGGAKWDAARLDALANTTTAAIEAIAPGFGSRIVSRVAWSPADLEQRFGLTEGAPHQGELGLDQILFMRPVAGWGRHATPIAGLTLGGCGSHPGPGVLGGAGWLAAGRVLKAGRR